MSDPTSPEVPAAPMPATPEPAVLEGAAKAAASGEGAAGPAAAMERAFHISPHDVSEAPKLSVKQITALKCLANGESIQDAACTANVTRTTVWRWMTEHPAFRAAYNRWKAAAELSARSRLVALQDLAIEVVTEELENKRNGQLAASLLAKMGTLTPTPAGATEERRAAKEIETEKRQRDLALARTVHDVDLVYDHYERHLGDDPPTPKPEQPAAEPRQSR